MVLNDLIIVGHTCMCLSNSDISQTCHNFLVYLFHWYNFLNISSYLKINMVSDGNCYVEFTNPGEVTFNQSCFVFVILLVYVLDELKKSPPKRFHESNFMRKAAALLLTFGVVCVYLGAFLGLIKVQNNLFYPDFAKIF